ncbi:hypothetical protein VSS37_01950 [Candidatus Thiothrix sp. Deng01]|uniref:Bro-N domain-containing protein n=1 Tax=Candidatus Thiothrix phosphatis TaxID=3112415 RepID=A0ABU6CTK8_9GAMM|nr:hypothetical protein [Candidatus Thiothrix sp. Deng01]MEB4589733.1 hypothetical protein [Candidatus Thiothrix sp. Deng01]
MAAPSQIQARYVEEEDRILLRINTVADEEFRFWLTRRFLRRLSPVLQEGLMSSPTARQQLDYVSRQAVMAFEHERAQSKAEFNSPFRETGKLPLGTDPLLIVRAGFRNLEGGGFSVALKNGDSKGIDLTLTSDLLHLVCKLLDDAAQKSGWDIPALLQGVGDAAAPVTASRLN